MSRTNWELRFWLATLGLVIAMLWLFSNILLPFVAGMAIAYFLDPVADRLESWHLPRWLAATVCLLAFLVAFVAAVILLVPLIQAQILDLINSLPLLVEWLRDRGVPALDELLGRLSEEDSERLRQAASQYAGEVVNWLGTVLRGILSGGLALFDVLSVVLITPVVAFYLLRDWDPMIDAIDRWLPRQHADVIRAQAHAIDETLAGFVRGQATVCLALGLFYAVALSVVGLNFGLVVGLFAGLLSFIPYVGSLTGFILSVGIAIFQYDTWAMVAVVAGIFVFGQVIEGNFLTPKLVGERVGLHPVWVIFALLAGGSLFGFVGVLLAVPVAAVIGVLVRFGLRQYMGSRLYQGEADAAGAAPAPDGPVVPAEPTRQVRAGER